jgi:hypothetical protein
VKMQFPQEHRIQTLLTSLGSSQLRHRGRSQGSQRRRTRPPLLPEQELPGFQKKRQMLPSEPEPEPEPPLESRNQILSKAEKSRTKNSCRPRWRR